VKKVLVICLALLFLASMSALAADKAMTINGGKTTIIMGHPQSSHRVARPAVSYFFNDIGTGYDCCDGWTVSAGTTVGATYSPANQFISTKSGTTKKVSVGYGFVEGTNSGIVDLVKDCSNAPCSNPEGKPHICQGVVKNMPTFGDTSTTVVSIKCKAKLKKGGAYWVLVQATPNTNSWLAWNLNEEGVTGYGDEGYNGEWEGAGSGWTTGAIVVQ